jgi:trimeric autotransporter adhesin
VWSVDGFAGGTGSTGPITASGVYSPASTIFAGHSVTISATTQVKPASSASMTARVLNPLPSLTSGYAIQKVPGGTFLLDISGAGFVSASQLQVAGADVATVFLSSIELQSVITLSAGTTTINVGVLNPNAEQKAPITRMLPVQEAAASAVLSGFACGSPSITGSGSDACTVTLTEAAANGGLSVSLASSNAAATVPGTVLIPANGSSAGFVASAAPVTSAQAAMMTATEGGVTENLILQLNATVPTLRISPRV